MSVQPLRPPTVYCDYRLPWYDGRPDPCIASVEVPTNAREDWYARGLATADGWWVHVDGKDYCPHHATAESREGYVRAPVWDDA